MIEIHVLGNPVAQPRPRVTMRGKFPHAYVPKDHPVWAWRVAIRASLSHTPPTHVPLTGPLAVDVRFFFERPKAHYLRGILRDKAPVHHTSRPDIDNILKPILDVLTEAGLWKDDSQVCCGSVTKLYATKVPGATIIIRPAPGQGVDIDKLFPDAEK